MIKTVLTIAGSDPCGGAGIQADLKTMAVIGVYGAAVITCITVQNSRGVTRVAPLDPGLVRAQIEAVTADHAVSHVKVGMVGTAAVAGAVRDALAAFRGEVIVDPVLSSTTGQELADRDGLTDICASLLGMATVLTPNIPELEILTAGSLRTGEDVPAAARLLFDANPRLRCLLVKGGHAGRGGRITDALFRATRGKLEQEVVTQPFIITRNSHGTGCTLASAFAAWHALTGDDTTAFRRSVAFLQNALERSKSARIVKNPTGGGGLLHHLASSPVHQ
ncbi:MAG: bifunctional hydroxymethylpyrimidine kinase/phosphomethylpyrimidine kinase [Desulfobulbaceae bacterium]|nr:bifunctional hydroxymethylpyrimidine kinase/phosphomethylpyrimidine kinase [Desulfobulbaceae bacterium]